MGNPTIDLFADWQDGDTINASVYKQERELLRVAIVDNFNRVVANASQTALMQLLSEKNAANGYAGLDSGAKIPIAYLPDSIVGQLEYMGTWNASTNLPSLASPSTSKGNYYVTSVAGTYLSISYNVGDWVVSNGTAWEKVDNTDAVSSFNGRLGAILPADGDYLWSQINKAISSLADLTTRSASDLNTGTLPVGLVPMGIPAINIGNGTVDNAHLAFLSDVTGLIQAQLNAKTPLTHVGAGGSSQHPDATPSQSGFISSADLVAFRSLTPTGVGSYMIPVGQALGFWSRYSQEQDPVTGELVFYEI